MPRRKAAIAEAGSPSSMYQVLADDANLALQWTEPPLLDAGPRTAPGITRHEVVHVRR